MNSGFVGSTGGIRLLLISTELLSSLCANFFSLFWQRPDHVWLWPTILELFCFASSCSWNDVTSDMLTINESVDDSSFFAGQPRSKR